MADKVPTHKKHSRSGKDYDFLKLQLSFLSLGALALLDQSPCMGQKPGFKQRPPRALGLGGSKEERAQVLRQELGSSSRDARV